MMMKKGGFFFVSIVTLLALYSFMGIGAAFKKNRYFMKETSFTKKELLNRTTENPQQENHPPVVKITAPKNNSSFEWNATVPYTIHVTDEEDGDSQFDEIPSNEIFLEVRYIPDASKVTASVKQVAKKEPSGLAAIKASNCLNCHAFTTKLIGPSFYDISKRYPAATASNTALLVKHIQEGSTGVWGNVSMPTHPELSKEQAQDMVQWILKNAAKRDVAYYRGTQGSFRMSVPDASKQRGAFVLTATYTDHGAKDHPKEALTGQDVVVVKVK